MVVLWGLVTHPLLTAFPRDGDAAWEGAVGGGQPYVAGTGGYAADLPVHTHTVVFTAGLEGLAAVVDDTLEVTGLTLLGHADPGFSVAEQGVVAVQVLVVITGLQQRAGLPQLSGTHLTAATAVQDQTGTDRAGKRVSGAGAGLGAVLGHRLQTQTRVG